ncbi:rho-N domain-containing protein 1, chloroplastic-like [Abrus precatorius]|uniref:Rho-N domain-containing protein 1, chloroplastic-like n=1 Tax=Abrus precatorius TaxID=3816 RepID=A0A8B8L8N4_ABRPR|nr:rho-N domain-containing protein 1, chloroplastic-like [Abrus precatorius]
MHLVANNVAGCGVSVGKYLPCLGVSGRTASVFSCSSLAYHRIYPRVKIRGVKCSSMGASFVCEARRNPESFSRQNKNGFSRSRNWLNEGRDSFENFEEDMLSSKNSPVISLSSTPKSPANAVPGPREKEIVALFKKVQARIREKSVIKEVKKVGATLGQGKESGSVDSLLKLLRKHSIEQVKRSSRGGRETKFCSDQLHDNKQNNDSQSTRFSDIDSTSNNESQETNIFVARPPSNFQRRSPVPRLKYQSVSYKSKDVNEVPLSSGIREKDEQQIGLKLDSKLELDSELELDPKDELFFPEVGIADMSEDDSLDSEAEQIYIDELGEDQHESLSTLKLTELREVAKSRGLKGFSKLKKSELLELLTGS